MPVFCSLRSSSHITSLYSATFLPAMAIHKSFLSFLLLSVILIGAFTVPGFGDKDGVNNLHYLPESLTPSQKELKLQGFEQDAFWRWRSKNAAVVRRLMIGSVAPRCTYECRGCRFKCKAKQIPVDASDPINGAYHYRCVCHR